MHTDHELPASFDHHEHDHHEKDAPFGFTSPPASPASGPEPAQAPPPAPAAQPSQGPPPPPSQEYDHHDNAATIILQWLTYAFWGWTVLVLSVLTYTVFTDFLDQGDNSSFSYYIISAALVLLPISLICDYLYSKKEPGKKTGAASIVMVVHGVLFALFGIGALIWGVFSVVSLLTSDGDTSTTLAGLYSSLIIALFYAATFARTLNPPKFPMTVQAYRIAMSAVVVIFIILGFVGAHHNVNKTTYSSDYGSSSSYSSNASGTGSSGTSSSYNYPDKEEVNKQGQRRPVQYLHICDTTDGSIEYVSQGSPKCLGSDQFQRDYDPSVAGTVFSSPCKTDSGKLRYVYISNDETCPAGTTLLFYNSLGGSTTGPGGGG